MINAHDLYSLLGVLTSAFIAIGGVIYVQRSTRALKNQDDSSNLTAERQRLEAAAYERARESYEAALRTRAEEMRGLERRVADAEERAKAAKRQADKLEKRVIDLEEFIESHNIPLPKNEDD